MPAAPPTRPAISAAATIPPLTRLLLGGGGAGAVCWKAGPAGVVPGPCWEASWLWGAGVSSGLMRLTVPADAENKLWIPCRIPPQVGVVVPDSHRLRSAPATSEFLTR
ncbi:hypothetical protein GCM10009533_30690 [Saccharopolyspora spinosporotrichia]|uniref:Secreted protein n=1 Tax=Saccharopolyspora erythraea TaxID=1836 RepID=A0ABP3MW23_SACER